MSGSTISNQDGADNQGLSYRTRSIIAFGALILCLLIGFGIVYWLLFATSPKHERLKVDPKEQTQDFSGRPFQPQVPRHQPPTAWQLNDTTWIALSDHGAMQMIKEKDGNFSHRIYYWRNFLSPEQNAIVTAIGKSRRDDKLAKQFKLTKAQSEAFRKFKMQAPQMELSDAEVSEMRQLMTNYMKAPDAEKGDCMRKVTGRLEELAKQEMDVSCRPYIAMIEEIKKILSPEQLQEISKV